MHLLHASDQPLPEACPFGGLRAGSGSLLDRIGIHIEVTRVEAARQRQRQRFAASERLLCNADMGPAEVREMCQLDETGRGLLRAAMQQLHLSARANRRVPRPMGMIAGLTRPVFSETVHPAGPSSVGH